MILSILFFFASGMCFFYYFLLKKKSDRIEKAFKMFQDKPALKESAAFGVGLAGMSILDTYLAMENHSEILSTMENRFNHELGVDTSSSDWVDRVGALKSKGELSLQGDYNAYVGEAAEKASIEKLADDGIEADQFESRTHPDDDLLTENGDAISVKSLGENTSLKSIIEDHPESDHYIINSEKYQSEFAKGNIEAYENQGITIEDGGFSHDDHLLEIKKTYSDISDAADIADEIPFVSILFFGRKVIKEMDKLIKDKQSLDETGINLTTSAGKIAVNSVAAGGGVYVGSTIGTFLMPGVGTITGGIIGAIGSWFISSVIFSEINEKWKYGKIKNVLLYFAEKRETYLNKEYIQMRFFKYGKLKRDYANELNLHERYKESMMSPYSIKTPSPPAIMSYLAQKHLSYNIKIIDEVSGNFKEKLLLETKEKLANTMGSTVESITDDSFLPVIGEIMINSCDVLGIELSKKDYDQIKIYEQEKKSVPNYPYKIYTKPKLVVPELVARMYRERFGGPYEVKGNLFEEWLYPLFNFSWVFVIIGLVLLILQLKSF